MRGKARDVRPQITQGLEDGVRELEFPSLRTGKPFKHLSKEQVACSGLQTSEHLCGGTWIRKGQE